MKLDAAGSRLTVNTFAEGLFSAFAHDLAIDAHGCRGDAADDGADVRARLEIPVGGLVVDGVVRHGHVDRSVLAPDDRASIERQLRDDVLRGSSAIVAEGVLERGRARIVVTVTTGASTVTCDVDVTRGEGTLRGRGATDLSLRALGISAVKGPMGAFRIADRVRVSFDLLFRA